MFFKKIRAFIVFIVFVSLFSALGENVSPVVFVKNSIMNFGTLTVAQVSKNKNLNAVFKIQNKSDQILKIEKIATSCGCTSAKPDKVKVRPGESINLDVCINLEGKSGKNKAQIIVTFSNRDLVRLEVNYDVQIDAALFPLQLMIKKKNAKPAEGDITAYFSFSSPITEEKLPKIELLSKNPAITIKKKGVKIGQTPNELNGHYYCSIDFEASVKPEVTELLSSCVLTQDGDPIRSIPIIITERKDVTLRRSSFIMGTIKQSELVPIHLEVDGLTSEKKPILKIEGLVDESLKIERQQDKQLLSFNVRWDRLGFSSRQGMVVVGDNIELPFSCIANVVVN